MPSGKYFRVSEEIHRLVKIAAAKSGADIGQWIEAAARAKLAGGAESRPADAGGKRAQGNINPAGPEHEQLASILANGAPREVAAVRVVLGSLSDQLARRGRA